VSAAEARGAAALLAGLAQMTPRRLGTLLAAADAVDAWGWVCAGDQRRLRLLLGPGTPPTELAKLVPLWQARAEVVVRAGRDPHTEAERHEEAGVEILLPGDPRYPALLAVDPAPPGVLFVAGDVGVLDRPRVAIVGTRRCSGSGAAVARDLGRDLAVAGVVVVSGLALGIDGAAHAGVLSAGERGAPPAGVIGCGHDRPYPSRHRPLWEAVRDRGVLLGEYPLGTEPAGWRFPARNRMIAALAELVVVVESHAAGGSLLTVDEAVHRGVEVMAVPGSVRSPSAAGTNQLLAEGCHPVRDAADVLVALGLGAGAHRAAPDLRPAPDAAGRDVLLALGWDPATLEQLVVRTGRAVPEVALVLLQLEADGWVASDGAWYEQVAGS
jgi:DNA processing protein